MRAILKFIVRPILPYDGPLHTRHARRDPCPRCDAGDPIPSAFGQVAEAGGGVDAVEWWGPHGDHVIEAAPDGRNTAVQWEPVPMPRQEVNGMWAPYAIERTRAGTVEFCGGLDLRFERADCSVRTAVVYKK